MHSKGLTSIKARELQQVHGFNETESHGDPEWRKVLKRYLDPITLVIVRYLPCALQTCRHSRIAIAKLLSATT